MKQRRGRTFLLGRKKSAAKKRLCKKKLLSEWSYLRTELCFHPYADVLKLKANHSKMCLGTDHTFPSDLHAYKCAQEVGRCRGLTPQRCATTHSSLVLVVAVTQRPCGDTLGKKANGEKRPKK